MKVLHLGAGNIYGGIERALVTYAASKAACEGMAPEFVLCFRGQLEAELRGHGAEVTIVGPARLMRWRSIHTGASETCRGNSRPSTRRHRKPWTLDPLCSRSATRDAQIPLAVFL